MMTRTGILSSLGQNFLIVPNFARFAAALCTFLFAPLILATSQAETPRVVIAFGDSLTAGFGLSPSEAWPALLEKRLNERDGAGSWRVINSGVSGETSSGGLRRVAWVIRQPRVDVFILALGANDGLRGQPLDNLERNLRSIVSHVRARHPEARIILAGMHMPRNLGADYADAFGAVFPRVAESEGIALIPFLLEGVAAIPELNLPDQIHPNEVGQRRVEENVWSVLEPILESQAAAQKTAF
jgi:acyl-CoA thioesterase-1